MSATPRDAARALMARAERELRARDARAEELRRRLPEAAARLRDEYGARRVILFGSLAWGGVHASSDVDLAVEGVPYSRRGEAMYDLGRLFDAVVEVFLLEELPPDFRRRIETEGEVLA
ncbi:MAG: nucleotidyltransferase family protein [Myxococcota bacterium]